MNDSEINDILDFAIKTPHITSISYQPIVFTGRMSHKDREEKRFTKDQLAYIIEQKHPNIKMLRDWYPMSATTPMSKLIAAIQGEPSKFMLSVHAHCSIASYLIVNNNTKEYWAVPSFIDVEPMLKEMNELAKKTKPGFFSTNLAKLKAFGLFRKYFINPKPIYHFSL